MSDKVDSDSEVDFEEVKKTIKEMKAHARAINKEARDLDAVYKRSGLEGNTPRSRVHTVESDAEEPVEKKPEKLEKPTQKQVKIIVSEPTSAEESEVKPVKAPKKVVKKESESELEAKKSVTPVPSDASDDSEVEPAYQKMKGTREQVYEGIAYMTSGGLKKKDIFFENGLYKSLKMSKGAKERFGKDK
jgi:hypothetical protein